MKNHSAKFAFLASAVTMFGVAQIQSCSSGGASCDASNCPTGCCDASGMCQNQSTANCGNNGETCSMCSSGQQCKAGACVGASSNGGGVSGAGGGTTAAGGGTTAAGGGTAHTGGGTAATGGGTAATGGGTAATGGGTAATGGGTAATGGGTAGTGGGTADAGCTTLTVKNYLAWCNVTVNGGAASSSATQTVCVAPGTIPVTAVALSGFELGLTPWHDTSGDTGTGEQGTLIGTGQSQSSATTVVVGASAKCAWVCCETSDTTDCPTTDQCP